MVASDNLDSVQQSSFGNVKYQLLRGPLRLDSQVVSIEDVPNRAAGRNDVWPSGILFRRLVRFLAVCLMFLASDAFAQAPAKDSVERMRAKLLFISQAMLANSARMSANTAESSKGITENDEQLSWLVHLLPYIGEPELYEEFHLNEPWNSSHNQTLISRMPKVFSVGDAEFKTRFQVFTGPNLLFRRNELARMELLKDSHGSTILIAISDATKAVSWTGPDALEIDRGNPAELLGKPSTIECVMANCSLISLPGNIPAVKLLEMLTPMGGEKVDTSKYRINIRKTSTTELLRDSPEFKFRVQILLRMNQIGKALQQYKNQHHAFPVVSQKSHFDDRGHPKLSWRVHLLPYLNEDEVFKKFKLNEAWDSPHNKQLLSKMPAIFREASDPADSTTTRLKMITGHGTGYGTTQATDSGKIEDPGHRTILMVRVGSDKSVEWTKPEDAEFEPDHPKSVLGDISDIVYVVMADSLPIFLSPKIPDALFRSLVTANGHEEISNAELYPWELKLIER